MAREDKSEFEAIEEALSITPQIMADTLKMKTVTNIYQSYRIVSKMNFFKVLAYGVYVIRSGLSIEEVVKSIEYAKDIKGIK